ncbi:MAG: NTP transferase domain-containing protein [Proteobacteria bacterium]|nr:NTP transferase domain-containing protein [Pseudomonadota bacterium]
MDDLSTIDAAVLAGGLGTRLRPVVSDRPKVLAPVVGRPFLTYLLDQLREAGLDRVVLCTGYMGEKVEEEFGDRYGELYLDYSMEPRPLGTGGALEFALPFIETETVLVVNGDSYCSVDLSAMWETHMSRNARASILLTEVDDVSRYGRVRLDDDSAVVGFDEKDSQGGPGWINAGIYLIERALLKEIPPGKQISLEKDIFPNWVGKGFYGWKNPGRFLDIGTEQSLAMAQQFFA